MWSRSRRWRVLALDGRGGQHVARVVSVEESATGWTLVRFRLWGELRPELAREGRQLYQVGHVSLPHPTVSVPATA